MHYLVLKKFIEIGNIGRKETPEELKIDGATTLNGNPAKQMSY